MRPVCAKGRKWEMMAPVAVGARGLKSNSENTTSQQIVSKALEVER